MKESEHPSILRQLQKMQCTLNGTKSRREGTGRREERLSGERHPKAGVARHRITDHLALQLGPLTHFEFVFVCIELENVLISFHYM